MKNIRKVLYILKSINIRWVNRISTRRTSWRNKRSFRSLVLAGLIAALFFQFLSPFISNVYSAPKGEHPSDYALKVALYNAFRNCAIHESGNQTDRTGFWNTPVVNEDHAKSGDWWVTSSINVRGKSSSWRTPSWLSNGVSADKEWGFKKYPGGKYCSDILKEAVPLWGFSDGLDLLCKASLKRHDGSSCEAGHGPFDIKGQENALSKAIRDKAFGGETPHLRGEDSYQIYLSAFTQGCQAKEGNTGSGDFNYKDVSIVDEGSKEIKKTRFEAKKKSHTVWIYTQDGLSQISNNCEFIAKKVSEYAPAYKKWLDENPDAAEDGPKEKKPGDDNGGDEDGKSSCQVKGLGWLVCPVVLFLGQITDQSYGALEKLFMIRSEKIFDTSGQTYELWSFIRNIANSLFVLFFLLIVMSQVSSIGLSNYSIKRLLPRILLVAIAVNLSFIFCTILADVSNILGANIKVSLDELVGKDISIPTKAWEGSGGFGGWEAVGAVILTGAAAATFYFSTAAFIGLAIAVVLAVLTVIIVLSVRQALIIMLVCISPLAFCAYLLPNTENLLKRWWSLFKILLLMYPIVGFIFGASSLASSVIMSTAGEDTLLQLVGAAVAVIPLFITPIVMKTAGGLLNKIGAITNDKSRGSLDRFKNGAGKFDDERRQERGQRRNIRALNGTGLRGGRFNPLAKNRRRSIRRQARLANTTANSEAAEAAFNVNDNKAREASIDSAHASMAAGAAKSGLQSEAFGQLNADGNLVSSKLGAAGETRGIAAAAIAGQKDAAKADAVKNVTSTIDDQSVGELADTLSKAINDGDKITAIASEQLLGSKGEGGAKQLNRVIGDAASAENGMTPDMRTELSRNLPVPMMDKLETLKTWSNSTSSDGQGISWSEAQQKAMGSIPEMPMQKLQGLSPSELEGALDKGAFNTPEGAVKIQQMSEPRNYSGFKDNVQQAISRESANPGAKQQEVKLEQEIKQTTNDTLKIIHDTKPSGPSNSRVSAVSAEVDKATQSIDRANQALDRKISEQKAQQKARENLGYQDRE